VNHHGLDAGIIPSRIIDINPKAIFISRRPSRSRPPCIKADTTTTTMRSTYQS
jgi:hypothetical protein